MREFKIRGVLSFILYQLVLYTWTQSSTEQGGIDNRNASASTVYIVSFIIIIAQCLYTMVKDRKNASTLELGTLVAMMLIKPILLVNGAESQNIIFISFLVIVALKLVFSNLVNRPSPFMIAVILTLTMNSLFFRTGHREMISSI